MNTRLEAFLSWNILKHKMFFYIALAIFSFTEPIFMYHLLTFDCFIIQYQYGFDDFKKCNETVFQRTLVVLFWILFFLLAPKLEAYLNKT